MRRAGFVDQRYTDDRPSMSELGKAAGNLHTSTIASMIFGDRDSKTENVDKVAAALKTQDVHKWVGRARTEAKPFEPHPDANLLDRDEQIAVNELIRLLARSKRTASVTPIKRAASVIPDTAAARRSKTRPPRGTKEQRPD